MNHVSTQEAYRTALLHNLDADDLDDQEMKSDDVANLPIFKHIQLRNSNDHSSLISTSAAHDWINILKNTTHPITREELAPGVDARIAMRAHCLATWPEMRYADIPSPFNVLASGDELLQRALLDIYALSLLNIVRNNVSFEMTLQCIARLDVITGTHARVLLRYASKHKMDMEADVIVVAISTPVRTFQYRLMDVHGVGVFCLDGSTIVTPVHSVALFAHACILDAVMHCVHSNIQYIPQQILLDHLYQNVNK